MLYLLGLQQYSYLGAKLAATHDQFFSRAINIGQGDCFRVVYYVIVNV